jgi:TRAP-type C4-dicarboxylate transport system permease small subunit
MAAGTVGRGRRTSGDNVLMRLSSETKHATKTTEFYAMIAIIAGILIASWIVGQGDGNGNANVDAFPAVRAWLYVAIVGVGYMVSRGLAKAGSRDPYWASGDDLPGTRDADQAARRDR